MTESIIELSAEQVQGFELFPMKLVSMEKFMFWDESDDYGKVFRIGLEFDGTIDENRLIAAFRIAIVRHALLCASIDDSPRELRWQLAESIRFQYHRTGNFSDFSLFEPNRDH